MSKKKVIFEEVDPSKLRFARPCKYNHAGPDGQGVRYNKKSGWCVACACGLPDGPFTFQFVGDIKPAKVFQTPEEKKQRHIQQVMEYQKRNPEKHKEIMKKYHSKEEVKVRYAERSRKRYQERKDEIRTKNREYYLKTKEKNLAYQREYYQRKKLRNQETSGEEN